MSPSRKNVRGFTLIEVMVAATLSILVLAGLATVFVGSSRSFREDQKASSIADEGSLAMAQLTEDLEMAGFWTDLQEPGSTDLDDGAGGTLPQTMADDCGAPVSVTRTWTYGRLDPSIFVANNITTASPAAFPCITDAVVGTDVVGIKRVNGTWSASTDAAGTVTGATVANRVYLRTNGTVGTLYRATSVNGGPVANGMPAGSAYTDWEYRMSVYYIRSFAQTAGDGIPSLCRKLLQWGSPPTVTTECFAQGIENLQIEVGTDTGSSTPPFLPDGVVEQYLSGPTAAQLAQAAAFRIWLLTRSINVVSTGGATETLMGQDAAYTNTKTYTFAGNAITVNDNFYRKLLTGVVLARNPANLRQLQ